MKVAYVAKEDPGNIHAWSGLVHYKLKALQSAGLNVTAVGKLKESNLVTFVKGFLYGRIIKKTYFREYEPTLLKSNARQLERVLAGIEHEIVFSSRTFPIAYLRTEKPVVFWHDATFVGLLGLYPGSDNYSAETIKYGNRVDQLALTKCCLAIYSSEWAADTARNNYVVNPDKVKVVPFGANIECRRTEQDIQAMLQAKCYNTCRLLFMGREWARKGGDVAVAVAEQLNRRGIPTELHLAGCKPPEGLPGWVKAHGFISKASEAGRRLLDELFTQAHFFILPTRADCTPVVFPEACSFGLPVLTTNVGGTPTVIREGKNGFAFPLESDPQVYCDTIQRYWSSRIDYEQLALSSFQEYTSRLNWAYAGRLVRDLIEEYCR